MQAESIKKADSRAARRARGECEQCGVVRDDAVSIRMCAACLHKHRLRNRRYHARQIESGEATGIKQRRMHEWLVREYRRAKMIAFAREHGRVPTLGECTKLLDLSYSTATAEMRRAAFGLRKKRPVEVRVVVPYPVPEEWLGD